MVKGKTTCYRQTTLVSFNQQGQKQWGLPDRLVDESAETFWQAGRTMGEGAVLKRRTVKQQSGASKSTFVFVKTSQWFCENQPVIFCENRSVILAKSEYDFGKIGVWFCEKSACDVVKSSQWFLWKSECDFGKVGEWFWKNRSVILWKSACDVVKKQPVIFVKIGVWFWQSRRMIFVKIGVWFWIDKFLRKIKLYHKSFYIHYLIQYLLFFYLPWGYIA